VRCARRARRDRAEEEFREWYRKVEAYISSLESEAKREQWSRAAPMNSARRGWAQQFY